MSTRQKALLAIILVAMLWGTAGIVAKTLLRELSPFVITFYRFMGAALLLLPFTTLSKKPSRFWRDLVPLSLLNTINVFFFYFGMTTTTVVAASILGSATPLVTLLLSHIIIREQSTWKERLGISIGLIGALAIIVLPALQQSGAIVGDLRGNILLCFGVLSWALYSVFSRKILTQKIYTPLDTAMVNFAVTGLVSLVAALVLRQPFITTGALTPPYILMMLYGIVGMTLVTFSLFQWAIKHIPVTTASLKDYIQLVTGAGLGIFLLHEPFTPSYLLGSVLVVLGVFIATGEKISKKLASLIFSEEK